MSVRMNVRPELIKWALQRASWTDVNAEQKFPRLAEWIAGDVSPTLRQLQGFAAAVHVPFGFLLLPEPPEEETPIPDFRTRGNEGRTTLSPDLRDTIHTCQLRQEWFRQFAVAHGFQPVDFVGSVAVGDPVEPVADAIRQAINFTMERRIAFRTWEEALRQLIDLIETAGILVSINGVVGADTHRKLDPDEFGGFALVDDYAPLIFVNAADTKAAQIFTIVHELAHIWAGESALSDSGVSRNPTESHEKWCNEVAAEVLVPRARIRSDYRGDPDAEELDRLAKAYRVSTLVILHRLFETKALAWDEFRERYQAELERVRAIADSRRASSNGGNFYFTQPLRLGRRFARAVVLDTFEGGTTYGEAYRLLGTSKPETFNKLAAELGVA
ncbi:ImmA/IrrE family metallo-endopeptidase [Cryobacterium sp. N19]|uniref:ImmA/IrrE family metallo-endopeptidase n=1 Tax=Cryobacterium sp. N19 TaxID=2048288 RepID=UPI000CE51F71|nr:ImmA/IrrE family metallo-endopeptidase [Cryobacterium sp. N19]